MSELLQWYNLIFVIPVLCVLVYLVLQFFSSLSDSIDGIMGDVAIEDLESKSDTHSFFWQIMSFLNFGKIPTMILIVIFCLTWGISGYIFNQIVTSSTDAYMPLWFFLSCLVALTSGVLGTKVSSEFILFFFPIAEEDAISMHDLVGKTAKIISGKVTERFGRARVSLDNMSITVFCRIPKGDTALKYGDEVVLLDFDEQNSCFYVEKFDLS